MRMTRIFSVCIFVPVRWRLTEPNGRRVVDRATFAALRSQPVACATGKPLGAAGKAAGLLVYDPLTHGYAFLWKTSRSWRGSCRLMTLELVDGQQHQALLRFR